MYSQGKKLLEIEQQTPHDSVDGLQKAKVEFELLLKALSQTEHLASNPKWISEVSSKITSAIIDYENSKTELSARLKALEEGHRDQLRVGIFELLQKSSALDTTFEEIKQVLNQIFRVVTSNEELKRRTLENINAELRR